MQPVKDQYATSKNLESRMNIYQYSVDPKPFSKWLVEQIVPQNHVKVLELGCGTGDLWKHLKGSFPDCEIILSDISPGMLEKSKQALGGGAFHYEIVDFHHIPFPDETFDVVISNHNLYHAVNLAMVLGEIRRVMKEAGVFYSTTSSSENMASLQELIDITDDTIWPNSVVAAAFGAETGIGILSKHFQHVDQRFYENELRLTDLAPVLQYYMSVRDERVHKIVEQSADGIRERFEAEIRRTGYYRVKTKACLFICSK